jgi:C-terminal processing protease CtpA/Prc
VRTGIEPDVKVKITQKDVFENRDRVLEKAVEMIQSWDRTVAEKN